MTARQRRQKNEDFVAVKLQKAAGIREILVKIAFAVNRLVHNPISNDTLSQSERAFSAETRNTQEQNTCNENSSR